MDSTTDKYRVLLEKFFNKKATEEEVELLIDWMKQTNMLDEFNSYCEKLWNNTSTTIEEEMGEDMWNAISTKIGNRKKRFRIGHTFYRAAAIILLPLCLCLGTGMFFMSKAEKDRDSDVFEILVDKGQKASVVLPDGTKAWVNSGTKLFYSYNSDERMVNMDGEAYFEVAKDKERRFTVSCNDLKVEALGTMFNVKGYSSDETVSVALLEGSVKVFNEINSTILAPNQYLSFNKKDETFLCSEIKDSREIDFWRRNILYFRSASLVDIAKTLERMYGVTIKFEDESLKHVPFSGSIRNSSLNNVFHIISLTYPITYEINNDTITINKEHTKKK